RINVCNTNTSYANYPLSLHDALPIYGRYLYLDACRADRGRPAAGARLGAERLAGGTAVRAPVRGGPAAPVAHPGWQYTPGSDQEDRKSTRLNSSHVKTSYAVFCLKKK